MRRQLRTSTELAMDRVALTYAASTGAIALAPASVRNDALKLARLITEG